MELKNIEIVIKKKGKLKGKIVLPGGTRIISTFWDSKEDETLLIRTENKENEEIDKRIAILEEKHEKMEYSLGGDFYRKDIKEAKEEGSYFTPTEAIGFLGIDYPNEILDKISKSKMKILFSSNFRENFKKRNYEKSISILYRLTDWIQFMALKITKFEERKLEGEYKGLNEIKIILTSEDIIGHLALYEKKDGVVTFTDIGSYRDLLA